MSVRLNVEDDGHSHRHGLWRLAKILALSRMRACLSVCLSVLSALSRHSIYLTVQSCLLLHRVDRRQRTSSQTLCTGRTPSQRACSLPAGAGMELLERRGHSAARRINREQRAGYLPRYACTHWCDYD